MWSKKFVKLLQILIAKNSKVIAKCGCNLYVISKIDWKKAIEMQKDFNAYAFAKISCKRWFQ